MCIEECNLFEYAGTQPALLTARRCLVDGARASARAFDLAASSTSPINTIDQFKRLTDYRLQSVWRN